MNFKNFNYIFLMGSSRSGTTWLQSIFLDHPQVAGTNLVELRLFNDYAMPMLQSYEQTAEKFKNGSKVGLPPVMSREVLVQKIKDFMLSVYQEVIPVNEQTRFIADKYPQYSLVPELIREIFPNSKAVHIIRDGRDVVVSKMVKSEKRGKGYKKVKTAAHSWEECVVGGRRGKAIFGDNYHEIRYEDILYKGQETIKKLFDFCEIPADEALVKHILDNNHYAVKSVSMPAEGIAAERFNRKKVWAKALTLEDRIEVARSVGYLLEELGYTQPGEKWYANSPEEEKSANRMLKSLARNQKINKTKSKLKRLIKKRLLNRR
ncbi:MAG TPA: sulfotransferase [Saprospiraceae bacterium]|nr:sulfotransferase [Saprospiraceae bacterium]HMQ83898.1 sulfotransferase [Saprospiraceae bacterium]